MDYLKLSRRRRIEEINKRFDPNSCIGNWREKRGVIRSLLTPSARGGEPFKIGSSTMKWSEQAEMLGRDVKYADELLKYLGHTGWYVDNFQDETCRGIVIRLTHGRFMAGVTDPWNFNIKDRCGPAMVELYVYDNEDDAARSANHIAEVYAESCREDDAKFQAEQQIAEAHEEIASIRDQIRELCAGIRESKLAPVVCERLRSDIRSLLHDKTRKFKRIAKLEDNYWEAVA